MKTGHVRQSLCALAALLAPITAHAFSLAWPIDCELGKTCFIQNYVDHDTTSGATNYACDPSTFDGLGGTDIRIQSLAAMRAGVAIKAAADGTVLGSRDGMSDVAVAGAETPELQGKDCGNGVQLEHAGGYRTQYCHLLKGSVRVKTGQQLKAGEVLGLVGLSGQTQFPHLNFNLLRNDQKLDPFTSAPASMACSPNNARVTRQLWATPIPYQPTSLLGDGMTDTVPTYAAMLDTPVAKTTLATTTPLLYWATVLNLKAGDAVTLTITAPDGSTLATNTSTPERSKAVYFNFIGTKNTAGKLAPGVYTPRITVMRAGVAVIDVTRSVTIQ